MAFRDNQFGRFGSQAKGLLGIAEGTQVAPSVADVHCARLLGTESPSAGCGVDSAGWLARRGYLPETDTRCVEWKTTVFPRLLAERDPQIRLLNSRHLNCVPICCHEFIPSTEHRPLYGWFHLPSALALALNGTTPIDNVEFDRIGAKPTEWRTTPPQQFGAVPLLWILDSTGELLVGPEAFRHVKHPSLACGQDIWAAGEIGFEMGKVRVVNLKTGHYLGQTPTGNKAILSAFVKAVFLAYNTVFLNDQGLLRFDTRVY